MKPQIFATPGDLRAWFEHNHATAPELWIGFYRVGFGSTCVGYSDALDLALCYGWIDGIRRKVDDTTYTNRFTRRKPQSNWSEVNVRRVQALIARRTMHPAGLAAFEIRSESRTGVYSFERKEPATLPAEMLRAFRVKKGAWLFLTSQPAWYRRTVTHWIVSAKQEATRWRRFNELLAGSASGQWIGPLARAGKSPAARQRPPRRSSPGSS